MKAILFGLILTLLSFSAFAQSKPTLTKSKDTKIRLAYKGKSAVVDLDYTDDVTLGSDHWHQYKTFFTAVKNGKIYFLFQEQGGSPMGNPMGPCGGDSPKTLVWLKTDLKLKIEEAKSEVFASCAYNGGRYQEGKTRIVGNNLKIGFEEKGVKYEITYDNKTPENSIELKQL